METSKLSHKKSKLFLSSLALLAMLYGSTRATSSSSFIHDMIKLNQAPVLQDHLNITYRVNTSYEANWTLYGNAFLAGVGANKMMGKNGSICFQNVTQFYFHEVNDYIIKLNYGNGEDNIFNTTALIANASLDLITCTYATENLYNYMYTQAQQFTSIATFGLAFFQHVVANILNLSMVYQTILNDMTVTKNTTDVYYQTGKIVNMLINVPPIQNSPNKLRSTQTQEISLEQNSDSFSSDATSLLTVSGLMNFSIGVLNGTQLYNMSNIMICRQTVIENWTDELLKAQSDFEERLIFDALINIWSMFFNLDSIAHSCSAGVQDIGIQMMNQNKSTFNQNLYRNILFNFGSIYDDLEQFYFFMVDTPYSTGETSASEAGNLLGNIVYLALKNPVPLDSNQQLQQVFGFLTRKAMQYTIGAKN